LAEDEDVAAALDGLLLAELELLLRLAPEDKLGDKTSWRVNGSWKFCPSSTDGVPGRLEPSSLRPSSLTTRRRWEKRLLRTKRLALKKKMQRSRKTRPVSKATRPEPDVTCIVCLQSSEPLTRHAPEKFYAVPGPCFDKSQCTGNAQGPFRSAERRCVGWKLKVFSSHKTTFMFRLGLFSAMIYLPSMLHVA
jgi:hypothetical protein